MVKYELMKQPNWIIETISCLIQASSNQEQKFITNSEKLGMDNAEMESFLSPLINYKKHVLEEIIPIASKYERILKYSKKTEIEKETLSELLTLVTRNSNKFLEEQTKERIDDIFNKHFTTVVNEYSSEENSSIRTVSNVIDLIGYFSSMRLDADFKMQMIELYSERYEVWIELAKFFRESEGICEKYFYIIKKEFEEAIEQLEQSKFLEDLISKSEILSFQIDKFTKITPLIFCYNMLTIDDTSDDEYECYIGIYTLQFIERKKNNRMNDKHLITDLKAVGDDTRLRIIRLLCEQKMYIQELADALNLTPATVSHHINILLQSRLVSISIGTEKSKKITYEVNKVRFEELAEGVKNIVNDTKTI